MIQCVHDVVCVYVWCCVCVMECVCYVSVMQHMCVCDAVYVMCVMPCVSDGVCVCVMLCGMQDVYGCMVQSICMWCRAYMCVCVWCSICVFVMQCEWCCVYVCAELVCLLAEGIPREPWLPSPAIYTLVPVCVPFRIFQDLPAPTWAAYFSPPTLSPRSGLPLRFCELCHGSCLMMYK